MTEKPINERAAAVDILTEITEEGAYANQALRKNLGASQMQQRGRAFVTEIVNETIRNLLRIDATVAAFSKTPIEKLKPFILNLLRVSICQLRYMDRVPPSAAVNEAVLLTKERGFANLSGFVNGVLRSISREPGKPPLPPLDPASPAKYICARYSYPRWIASHVINFLGPTEALKAVEAGHKPPSVTVFTNILKTSPDELAVRLREEGIECEPGKLHKECLRLKHTSDIAKSPAFADGDFFVMDEGAVSAVKALTDRSGMDILDMCAAPGGKAFAASLLMSGEGKITAWDVHQHKIDLLNSMAKRLRIKNISAAKRDALVPDASLANRFDAVLLDAPCSGFGIIRKKPDIKFNRKPADIAELAKEQRAFLKTAAAYVKPGGVLIYCTCTLTREENNLNTDWFAENSTFKKEYENLLPPSEFNDGFYIAKLRKTV